LRHSIQFEQTAERNDFGRYRMHCHQHGGNQQTDHRQCTDPPPLRIVQQQVQHQNGARANDRKISGHACTRPELKKLGLNEPAIMVALWSNLGKQQLLGQMLRRSPHDIEQGRGHKPTSSTANASSPKNQELAAVQILERRHFVVGDLAENHALFNQPQCVGCAQNQRGACENAYQTLALNEASITKNSPTNPEVSRQA